MKAVTNYQDTNNAYLFAALQKLIDDNGGEMTVVIPKPSDNTFCFNCRLTIQHHENELKLIFRSDNQPQSKR